MVFCPLVNAWFSIVNAELQLLNRVVPFGLLGKLHSALSSLPLTSEHSMDLDLQVRPRWCCGLWVRPHPSPLLSPPSCTHSSPRSL
ncbi:BPI fold-containing family B member 4 isoform X1 [Gallus gallus]|uniref:BPI fold-containing family B member 4 isoform X1 n=1 Tax=Gallus gallus TaxID=9031 RepID=UPI001F026CFE|nr:BPI fold-containing family B member 4 isoform X1 [Gallus gallus]